jgi:predicted nucleic acid-binding protein
MIAATAIEKKLTVVTRNTKDFKRFRIPLLNPFDALH